MKQQDSVKTHLKVFIQDLWEQSDSPGISTLLHLIPILLKVEAKQHWHSNLSPRRNNMAMENVVVDCFLLNIKTNNGNAINSECECELGKNIITFTL